MKNYALLTASLPRSHYFPWSRLWGEISRWNSMHFVMLGENIKTRCESSSNKSGRPANVATLNLSVTLSITFFCIIMLLMMYMLVWRIAKVNYLLSVDRSMICFVKWRNQPAKDEGEGKEQKVWNNICNKLKKHQNVKKKNKWEIAQ